MMGAHNLPPETLLGERYRLGEMVSCNGEGPFYIANDIQENRVVWVKEFYPTALAVRQGEQVLARQGSELPFKSLLCDFEDLLKALRKLPSTEHLACPVDILHQNGTTYGIYPDLQAKPLYTRLDSKESLGWNECKSLVLQLCTAVQVLHQNGIIHGGISPQTVLQDDLGNVYLTAFATSALRTDRTEIEEELYPGYSAPEQYSLNSWRGGWTDVYAIGALTYRLLLGKEPPDAGNRRICDKLNCLFELGGYAPENVCMAVERALSLSPENRFQIAGELSTALLFTDNGTTIFDPNMAVLSASEGGETMAFDPLRQHMPKPKAERKEPVESTPQKTKIRLPLRWMGIILASSIVLCGLVAVLAFPDKMPWYQPTVESPLAPVPEGTIVPSLVGMHINAITGNESYKTQFESFVIEVFDEQYPAGIVVAQSPPSGVKMLNRGTVLLTVSKGSVRVPMPNLVGGKLEFALETLTGMDIPYQVVESDDFDLGIVGDTSIRPGQMVNKEQDRVSIVIGRHPEQPPEEKPTESSPSSDGSITTRPA